MNNIFIQHHDIHALILEYQPGVGPVDQVAREYIPMSAEIDRGFYVEVNEIFIGVFASKKGPVFFYDTREFFLADAKYKVKVERQAGEYIFTLKYNEKVCVNLKYPPVKYKNYDNWSDEDMVDFFLWLEKSLNLHRERFVKYRTLE
ncbi:MAG: hypothetical protein IT310_13830 [Anaerolineales bacterium]|nr:hypothetical protein [Anaerolineales bacterium]